MMIICLVVFIGIISCVLGAPMPTYFHLVMGSVSLFNFLKEKKEETSMKKITMTAVGASAAVRIKKSTSN